ncbi:MAG TPA: hypothetical protein VIB79_08655 [Candidatus Binatia bacterium]|jgi:hypothetical protein
MNKDRVDPNVGRRQTNARKPDSFSLVPLLLTGETISPKARLALRENRMNDAAAILMQEYGLSCVEAGDLLNLRAC